MGLRHFSLKVLLFLAILHMPLASALNAGPTKRLSLCGAGVIALILGVPGVELSYRYVSARMEPSAEVGNWKGERRLEWGKLSPRWAQEYTGEDLRERFLAKVPERRVPVGLLAGGNIELGGIPRSRVHVRLQNSVAVVPLGSGGNTEHATLVANLIIDPQLGFSRRGEIYFTLSTPSSIRGQTDVRLVGISVAGLGEEQTKVMRELTEMENKIFIVPAGYGWNPRTPGDYALGWYRGAEAQVAAARNEELDKMPGIHVGSLQGNGRPAQTTPSGRNIDIAVPSDRRILSRLKADGPPVYFTGNSAASGGVMTGVAADILAFEPNISLEEMRTLIRRTALPLKNSVASSSYVGSGSLNAFKIFRVLEKRMFRGLAWTDQSLWDFDAESKAFLERGKVAMASAKSMEDRLQAMDIIRASFLLNPSEEAQRLLVNFYKEQELDVNAQFYDSILVPLSTER